MVEREALGAWFWSVEVGLNVLRGSVMVSVDDLTRGAKSDRLQGIGMTGYWNGYLSFKATIVFMLEVMGVLCTCHTRFFMVL